MKASTKYRQRLAQMAGREIPGGCMDRARLSYDETAEMLAGFRSALRRHVSHLPADNLDDRESGR
ncbi:hypothetical protein G6021_12955 [Dietzia sp. CW19]|uniref:hypothetical protein n=1 Tax=Dietzia sp. CW19 TaxID=1630634 RepID=UPI0015FCE211|nr:hypothetical protein [Dietzia sp. CW19]MBB1052000.1 hypothetical protein [Dietzia sp. CW19]